MSDKIKSVSDVYGITRELPLNYVPRVSVDNLLISSLTRDKHIVIYGSSKQGKTSVRKHCLQEDDYIVVHCSNKWSISDIHSAILKRSGYEITQSTTKTTAGKNKIVVAAKGSIFGFGAETSGEQEKETGETVTTEKLELDPEDVNDIIEALSGFNKFIVLEDFHYLPVEVQKDFSVALKAFHEESNICFIIVGVWLEESRLTVYNGDLTGRITGIDADKWKKSELLEVIESGEKILNIQFSETIKNDLLTNCLDNVYILQEACHKICTDKGIMFTHTGRTLIIDSDIDTRDVIKSVVNQQSGRYNSFITQFAAGFQDTTLKMYKWLLYPVLTADAEHLERGLGYREMRETLRDKHPEGKSLNIGNLTQALQATAALQVKKEIKPIVLDYDQTNLRLNVVDRGFIIWLANQDKNDLLELAELPVR